MKVLKEEITFNCSAENLWSILSDVTRCDWVPSVSEIKIEGDCRLFEMDGMGVVKEKILKNEDIFNRGYKLRRINLDESYPKYILDNKEKYTNWLI